VFGPGEHRGPGEGGVALTAAVDLASRHKVFVPSWDDVPREVLRRARRGDVVVTMGAPPISLMGDQLVDALAEQARSAGDGRDGPDEGLRSNGGSATGGASSDPGRGRAPRHAADNDAEPIA
jgi:UDP-N-acetylmuramate--alanine ligase